MAPQASTTEATLSRPADVTDTSIINTSSSADVTWLRENIQQLINNQVILKEQLNK